MNRSLSTVYGWLLVFPAAILLTTFTYFPALTTLWHSLFSTPKSKRASTFVGLENYAVMLEDPIFWKSLWNNLIYALGTIPISIGLALIMALWINQKNVGRGFLRMAYFTPTVLPMVAVANIWLFFYTPQYGLFTQIVQFFGFSDINWLGSSDTALLAIIIVAIWKEAGFFMIFYLAALQSISSSYHEAAILEGASRWHYLKKILWPLLMPTTLFILVNAMINAFRLIDHIMVMTKGGPDNATTVLLYYIFQVGFSFWDTAYAATLTIVLLLTLALITWLKFAWFDKRIHYQ